MKQLVPLRPLHRYEPGWNPGQTDPRACALSWLQRHSSTSTRGPTATRLRFEGSGWGRAGASAMDPGGEHSPAHMGPVSSARSRRMEPE